MGPVVGRPQACGAFSSYLSSWLASAFGLAPSPSHSGVATSDPITTSFGWVACPFVVFIVSEGAWAGCTSV